jgi:hypothetical protein
MNTNFVRKIVTEDENLLVFTYLVHRHYSNKFYTQNISCIENEKFDIRGSYLAHSIMKPDRDKQFTSLVFTKPTKYTIFRTS